MDMTVSAKKIEWETEGPQTPEGKQDWNEDQYGFWISFDPAYSADYPYHAQWGEGPDDSAATLDEAKKWCQDMADQFIREHAVLTPNAEVTGA